MKFDIYRNKFESIIYRNYEISEESNNLVITFTFEIPELKIFKPTLTLSKSIITNKYDKNTLNKMVFYIGMVELISYYKCICPKKVVIEAGYLDSFSQKWFKKLFYNGLGEFFYRNGIDINIDELFDFEIKGKEIEINNFNYEGIGNLIPIGGGKDSTVTLELLKKHDNKYFIINPKQVHYDCINEYNEEDICSVKRTIDPGLIELNKEGYLNGHTPFSAIVAFISYLVAYLTNRKYIALSNEASANEPTVLNTNINHQYSKSYEFEHDFNDFVKKNFNLDIHYFSLLRPIKEIQIALLFSNYSKYHKVFKSCNVGSKENPWIWCAKCPKCLFVYIMLVAFLSDEKVIDIFGSNMLDDKDMEKDFLELIGVSETKPFECVGTINEVIYALNMYIKKHQDLPYLVKLYKDNYYQESNIDLNYLESSNHNVPSEYYKILKEAINDANGNL